MHKRTKSFRGQRAKAVFASSEAVGEQLDFDLGTDALVEDVVDGIEDGLKTLVIWRNWKVVLTEEFQKRSNSNGLPQKHRLNYLKNME